MSEQAARAGFREVFGVAEFRALWTGQILSVTGDQLAKVALTVLVYDRTNSAILAAVTFAASFVPSFIGGVALTGLADRMPRRAVMIGTDLIRMVLAAVMVIPGVPLAVLVALLFLITMISPPFTAARAAVYPDILSGDMYTTGTAITSTTFQLAQVIGYAAGGVLTAAVGPRICLVLDAATFLASALLIRVGVAARPAPETGAERKPGAITGILAGVRLVFSNPALRAPMLLGWLAAIYNAPEAISAPWARELGGGALITGLLLAAPAAGYTISALTFTRLVPMEWRARLMRPLATACSALLIPLAFKPGTVITVILLLLSGCCMCFQPVANAAFVAVAPVHQRSQAFGLAGAGMALGQGAGMILAGVAAQHVAPAVVAGAAGALGAGAALLLGLQKVARPAEQASAGRPRQG